MEGTPNPGQGRPELWDYTIDAGRHAAATVLVVEDDQDIREMMTMLLEMAGFGVVACETAESGLNALREQAFDMILTDYALPKHSGVWLLENAENEDLIQGTPVLIVTAHPHVAGGDGYEIVQKPFDLDDLIERVRYRVEGDGSRRRRGSPAPLGGDGAADPSAPGPDCPGTVELILYVNSSSPRSLAAVENVKKVLERFHASRATLTVHDLALDPARGVADAVTATPALVRRSKGPRTLILGHVTNPELVLELLADCDADS